MIIYKNDDAGMNERISPDCQEAIEGFLEEPITANCHDAVIAL